MATFKVFDPRRGDDYREGDFSSLASETLMIWVDEKSTTEQLRLVNKLLPKYPADYMAVVMYGAHRKKLRQVETCLGSSDGVVGYVYRHIFPFSPETIATVQACLRSFADHEYWAFSMFGKRSLADVSTIDYPYDPFGRTDPWIAIMNNIGLFDWGLRLNLDMGEFEVWCNLAESFDELLASVQEDQPDS